MEKWLKTWRFYAALFWTNLRQVTALRGSFLLSTLFMALNNCCFFVFWWVLFRQVHTLRGWDMHDVALLFGVGATSFGLMQAVAGGAVHLSRFIDEGMLDAMLVQPKPTLGYALGCRAQASGFGDALSGIAFLWASGAVGVDRLPWVAVSVLCASVTFTASSVLFFSLAFWLPRTHATSRQALDVLVTFALYPEPLFRGALRVVLFTLIPAGFVAYLPVQIIRGGEHSGLGLTSLLAATLAYVWLARRVFRAGLRRYSSGSRFGLLT